MQNILSMLLFTSTYNYFVQRVMCSDRPYTYTIIFNLQIVSMECMMVTKSRIGELFLVGIQWVWLPVERKFFSGKLGTCISQCSTEFLVSTCKVATFMYVSCCRNNCIFWLEGGLSEKLITMWTKAVYPKVASLQLQLNISLTLLPITTSPSIPKKIY